MRLITIAIAMILIGAGAFVVFGGSSSPETDDGRTVLQYDDYVEFSTFASYPVTSSGTLNLVSMGGTNYVHAADIGHGSVTYTDGSTELFKVTKANLSVYMIAGQSNAAYRDVGIDPTMITGLRPGTAYYYGTSTEPSNSIGGANMSSDTSSYWIWPMVSNDGTAKIGGIDAPLAADLVTDDEKIMIVNTAVGGTLISTWVPGERTYERAKILFNDALNKIDNSRFNVTVKSYIWVQGEQDTATPIDSYISSFLEMHDAFTTGGVFSFKPLQKAFIAQTRAYNGVNSSVAQAELPTLDSTIILATTVTQTFTVANGMLTSDNIHYSQAGRIVVAYEVAIKIRSIAT